MGPPPPSAVPHEARRSPGLIPWDCACLGRANRIPTRFIAVNGRAIGSTGFTNSKPSRAILDEQCGLHPAIETPIFLLGFVNRIQPWVFRIFLRSIPFSDGKRWIAIWSWRPVKRPAAIRSRNSSVTTSGLGESWLSDEVFTQPFPQEASPSPRQWMPTWLEPLGVRVGCLGTTLHWNSMDWLIPPLKSSRSLCRDKFEAGNFAE